MSLQTVFVEKRKGVYRQVTLPTYGSQDVGITPGGVMDQFSFDCGNVLLKNPENSPALEMLIPPKLLIRQNIYFTLTGAAFENPHLGINDKFRTVQHCNVYYAPAGAELDFGKRKYGLLSYLCYKLAESDTSEPSMIQRSIGNIDIFNWVDKGGFIRVIEGPEYKFLANPDDLFSAEWTVSLDTNEQGMRLESSMKLEIKLDNMISEAVTTGTIQLTPNGPIILLKHRQTVGGYPRIFSVISSDVDLLTQYIPKQLLKFKKITIAEAWNIAKQKSDALLSVKTN